MCISDWSSDVFSSDLDTVWVHYGELIEQKWLPNYAIKDVLQDQQGSIWVATNAGLYKYHINETVHYDITRFTRDKYLNNELYSISELPDHSILVGTKSGIGRFLVDSTTVSLVGKDRKSTRLNSSH